VGSVNLYDLLLQAAINTFSFRCNIMFKQETRAKSTQKHATHNLSVSAVNAALWNSPPLTI